MNLPNILNSNVKFDLFWSSECFSFGTNITERLFFSANIIIYIVLETKTLIHLNE